MCYNISNNNKNEAALQKALGAVYPKNLEQLKVLFVANGFTHPLWPVLTTEKPKEFNLHHWGLIPAWTPNSDKAKQFAAHNLNAKCETLLEKPSFKKLVMNKRCLIPVTGFFEWREFAGNKYPYYIYLKDTELFCLGGLYDEWAHPQTGEIIHTFTIITTEANALLQKIHNKKKRMPLIFNKVSAGQWLNKNTNESTVRELMKPYPTEKMDAHTISKRITSRTENPDTEESLIPFFYPELELADL